MSSFTIGTTAQGIFKDGLQTATSLTNNGPYTIYLDTHSAVSSSSHPLPPSATLVWDAHQPLWAIAEGDSSTLILVLNGAATNANRASVLSPIYSGKDVTSSTTVGTRRYESSAYNSLLMRLATTLDGTGVWPTAANSMTVEFFWYDTAVADAAQYVDRSVYYVMPSPNIVGGSSISTKVLAPYFSVRITYNAAFASSFRNLAIFGSSRDTRDSVHWLASTLTPVNPGVSVITSRGYADLNNWTSFDTVYIDGIGNEISFFLRTGGAITAAGTLFVNDVISGTAIYALSVGTGGPLNTPFSFKMPVSVPVSLGFAPAPGHVGGVTLSGTFTDYYL